MKLLPDKVKTGIANQAFDSPLVIALARAANPSLGHGSGISANKACITVGKIKRKEMRLLFNTTNHHHRLAKIRLGMTSGMCQRHKHLSTAPALFTNVILDRRVAALEAVVRHRSRTHGDAMPHSRSRSKTRLAVCRCLRFRLRSSSSHWSTKPV